MSTISESADTMAHLPLDQNDASSHVASSEQKQVQKPKKGRSTLVEPDEDVTPPVEVQKRKQSRSSPVEPDENDTPSVEVQKPKQGGSTLLKLDESGTLVEEDEAGPEWSDNSMSIDDQKRLSRPIRKTKSATVEILQPAAAATERRKSRSRSRSRARSVYSASEKQQQVQPKQRAVRSSVVDEDEKGGHDANSILLQVIRYLYDILGRSLNLVKLPLAMLITLLILLVVLTMLSATITNLFCSIPGLSLVCWFSGPQVGASWKCYLPGSSRFFLECRPPAASQGTRDVTRLLNVHDELNNIQETMVGHLSLPLLIKRSETAMREVSIRVELSDIPSRSVLVPLFTDFWQEARERGQDVDKFFLHIDRAHDLAMGIVARTERRLEHIQWLEEQERTQPFMYRVLSVLQPESPSPFVLVREEYLGHLDDLRHHVDQLILENKVVLKWLEGIKDKLFVIGDHIAKDNRQLHDSQLSLKTGFFNKVRPDTRALRKIRSSLATLDEVGSIRKYGVAVFDASLVRLQRISAELSDLQGRIAAEEEAIEEAKEIASLELQIFMVRKSLTRMQEHKVKTGKVKEKYREDLQKQLDEIFNKVPEEIHRLATDPL